MNIKTIRIIKGCSPDREGLLPSRINELKDAGFEILFDEMTPNPNWPWTAGSIEDRSKQLNQALLESNSDAVMFARGGYGASDLLDLVPWDLVAKAKSKPIIGFSDVCAIQSALYTFTGRTSIHGPMPATVTWKQNSALDVDSLISMLKGVTSSGSISVTPVAGVATQKVNMSIQGKLYGGCFTVLTSLIGTKYMPKSLKDHILYFEDLGENPGRLLRFFNQWQHAGLLNGVNAIVLGTFSGLGGDLPTSSPILLDEIARRFQIPVFTSSDFGHISPNMPLVMGAQGKIEGHGLVWIDD